MVRICCLIVLSFTITACSLFRSRESNESYSMENNPELMKKFNLGSSHLEKEDYASAAKVFDSIMVEKPATDFDLVIAYNAGAAHEGLRQCEKAADRYRLVIRSSVKTHPEIQARALLRLSYVYECLGEEAKVISSLIDVRRRQQFLPLELRGAEVPARLAGAYARVGNFKLAETYFKEAERGLRDLQVQNQSKKNLKEIMARTLYFMGRLDSQKLDPKKVDQYFRSQRLLQRYLLKAVALDEKIWSEKASEEIATSYDNSWNLVDQLPKPELNDPVLAKQELAKSRNDLVKKALFNLKELEKLRPADPHEPKVVTDLYNRISNLRRRFDNYLAANATTLPLTPEAQALQSVRREGKVVGDVTPLEEKNKSKKAARKNDDKTKKVDPNL